MRITCPACGARFAVPEGAIPAAGRSVQCSACKAVWRARPEPAASPVRAPAEPAAPAPRAGPLFADEGQAPAQDAMAQDAMAQGAPAQDATVQAIPEATPGVMIASMNEPAPARRRGSRPFATGFALAVIAAAGALAVYAQRAAIVEVAPGLAQPLAAYAAAVDAGRAKLIETLR